MGVPDPIPRLSPVVLAACVVLFALGLGFGASGSAESPDDAAERLTGIWTNAASDRGLAGITHGIDQGLARMSMIGRRVARSRLLEANPPIGTLEVSVTGESIRVNFGGGRNTGAAPRVWADAKSASGDPIKIRYSIATDGVLKMECRGERGAARHTFLVSHDGERLRQDVKVQSSRLPNPIRYTLEYLRKQ